MRLEIKLSEQLDAEAVTQKKKKKRYIHLVGILKGRARQMMKDKHAIMGTLEYRVSVDGVMVNLFCTAHR